MHQTGFPRVYSRLLTGPLIVSSWRPCKPVENQLALCNGIDDIASQTRPVFVELFGSWHNRSKGGLVPFPQVLMSDIPPKRNTGGVSVPNGRIALTASGNRNNAPPSGFACPGDWQDMVTGATCQPAIDADSTGVFEFRHGDELQVLDFGAELGSAGWGQVCQVRQCFVVIVHPEFADFGLILARSTWVGLAGWFECFGHVYVNA